MIEIQKTLTIREVNKIIRDLNDELELYLTKKEINFNKTQPMSIKIKEMLVDQTFNYHDKFAHYMIKDEDLDNKIVALLSSINAYEKLKINRIRSIALANENEASIIKFREDENYSSKHEGKPRSWELISELSGYSVRQCKRIFQNYLNS